MKLGKKMSEVKKMKKKRKKMTVDSLLIASKLLFPL